MREVRGKPPKNAVLVVRIPYELREAVARKAYRYNLDLSKAVRLACEAWLVADERDIDNDR